LSSTTYFRGALCAYMDIGTQFEASNRAEDSPPIEPWQADVFDGAAAVLALPPGELSLCPLATTMLTRSSDARVKETKRRATEKFKRSLSVNRREKRLKSAGVMRDAPAPWFSHDELKEKG
jgi:hypothetical protein